MMFNVKLSSINWFVRFLTLCQFNLTFATNKLLIAFPITYALGRTLLMHLVASNSIGNLIFLKDPLAKLGTVTASRVERETGSRWKGISRYFDHPPSGRGEARVSLLRIGKTQKRDRVCFYSVDSTDRSCYSYARSPHSFAFFDGAAKWNASPPRYAPQILSLFLPPTEFSPGKSILSRRRNELYICLWLLWNSRRRNLRDSRSGQILSARNAT